jgi:acetyl esterase
MSGGSLDRYANGYFFTRDVLRWTTSLYTKTDTDPMHPEVSPIYGEITTNLAAACFVIAECDLLRDQAIAYAHKLRNTGVRVQCHYYRGVPHAFMAMAGALELGQQALINSSQQLKQAFEPSVSSPVSSNATKGRL